MRRSRRELRRERAALRALTSSALALFGAGAAGKAAADTAIDHVQTSYSWSTYSEDPLESSKTIPNGDTKRYDISTQQVSLAAPITETMDFSLALTHEKMSGGSPWYSAPDAAGTPVQIMSAPTIQDTRNDLQLHANYYTEEGRVGLGGGYSKENDYSAMSGGFDGERHFNEKNTTLSGGFGLSFDEINPTDADIYPTRPDHKTKQSYTGFLGLSQVMSRRLILQGSFTYNMHFGYLSDPYKEVFLVGGGTQFGDFRPNMRQQYAFLMRTNLHLEEIEATIHASYQYYTDSWSVNSHSFELSWYQTFGDSLQITPTVRYYSQSGADFYVPYLKKPGNPAKKFIQPDNFSSDFRLSPYGSLSFGAKAEYTFHTPWWRDIEWRGRASVERYLSSGDLCLTSVSVPAPGLVSFTVFSLGLTVVF